MSGLLSNILPEWPEWAVNLLLTMTAALSFTLVTNHFYTPADEKETAEEKKLLNSAQKTHQSLHAEFNTFRRSYLLVYLIIMLADWMQGTHMYTLYLSYNVNISALFLTGFLTGAIFAPFLGSLVDKFGRKRSCIIYCVLEIIINWLEHYNDFRTLLLGRILGGISTNLLFSAFESWMTTEHRKRGFPEEWMSRTYSELSIGNGSMAILAGVIAQLLEDAFGHIGPFQGAIALTALALVLILRWEENYGEAQKGAHETSSLYNQFTDGWKLVASDSKVLRIGLIQALSEGGIYTFVFMWVPTLLSMDPPGGVPTGCVFSALMMAITIGGVVFQPLEHFVGTKLTTRDKSSELSAVFAYIMASLSMAVPAICLCCSAVSVCFERILLSFVVIEFCVGLSSPIAGMLRSKYVPDAYQGAIMNIFRLPLNAVVVSGTYATDVFEHYHVYGAVSGLFLIAAALQATLAIEGVQPEKKQVKKD
mmetsp:Transcript_8859/g.21516  ORF Transcript_8859/g.21516 Transcript_8859/m.21516 type:complete len:478 (-) Transcript_8859:115-1548(-)|eukprot:CAMPEP_0181134694 /NCGR_PEP_ID=MMETSP1071-20121207/32227_1 /TAXON_ID=35127 /ORGANISM="Thalassiosira sp., Strain NH16" /LENGTH=477 /DNA_ID=CAMNT_0023221235 /DNA_START=215 /DNA_END=1648 /DNA_ORIENTATION=+